MGVSVTVVRVAGDRLVRRRVVRRCSSFVPRGRDARQRGVVRPARCERLDGLLEAMPSLGTEFSAGGPGSVAVVHTLRPDRRRPASCWPVSGRAATLGPRGAAPGGGRRGSRPASAQAVYVDLAIFVPELPGGSPAALAHRAGAARRRAFGFLSISPATRRRPWPPTIESHHARRLAPDGAPAAVDQRRCRRRHARSARAVAFARDLCWDAGQRHVWPRRLRRRRPECSADRSRASRVTRAGAGHGTGACSAWARCWASASGSHRARRCWSRSRYRPARQRATPAKRPLVLVGKTVTFDSPAAFP